MALKDLVDYITGLTARDVITPLATLLVGFVGAHTQRRVTRKSERDKVQAAHTAADIATADNITQRFKVLMDGYESRISDLTEEVTSLRSEVRENRDEIALLRRELENARSRPR